ncbi:tyrosine-protein kinase ZAP-70-like [Phalacrocorax aristotelis]|uniref:tyrosine-protein kinase ZAP-70-like n=1 Tax=Phalacrocorax aristotelis TaxID=126867 RepID=UPI003F4B82CF
MIILNHFFQKLLYHPLSEVRHCIAPLLFSKDGTYTHATELGNKVVLADPSHVEAALQQHLKVTIPDLTLTGHMKTKGSSIVVQGITPVGKAKIYIAKQQTLNDILQTNATDSDCERFQEVIKIVTLCQDRESIVKLQMSSACGVPPLYMMEDGNPLLPFLQEKRNKLPQSIITGILEDIARAVGSCHQKRVLLCNITPASFIVVAGGRQRTGELQVQVKLCDFFQARLAPPEDEIHYSPSDCPYETIKSGHLRGDSEEPLSVYFSAPESLQYHVFSAFSDAWAVAATFYSILLYGGQTYFELRYLPVSRFIEEVSGFLWG